MRRSPFAHPSLTWLTLLARCECLKRHGVGEREGELGADFTSLVLPRYCLLSLALARSIMFDIPTAKTVSIGVSPFGNPQPQIELRLPGGVSRRALYAALHRLAAEVELATPGEERWVVQSEPFHDSRGRVYLELEHGGQDETERGLTVLRSVAG